MLLKLLSYKNQGESKGYYIIDDKGKTHWMGLEKEDALFEVCRIHRRLTKEKRENRVWTDDVEMSDVEIFIESDDEEDYLFEAPKGQSPDFVEGQSPDFVEGQSPDFVEG